VNGETTYMDDLDALLESIEMDEAERPRGRGAGVRTPSRQSSFVPRTAPTPASQGQVQQTARSLDSKIETLSKAVTALETRTSALGAEQDRLAAALRKEVDERKKASTSVQADLQSTKTLAAILPLVSQQTTEVDVLNDPTNPESGTHKVKFLSSPDNQLVTLLPLFALMTPPTAATDGAPKNLFSDPLGLILLVTLVGRR
jgi:hypothetical protein